MTRLRLMTLLLAVALIAGAASTVGAVLWLTSEPEPPLNGTWLPGGRPLPEVTLIDHRGEPLSTRDLQGEWHFLFFGFTHCPDVCPVTLADLAGAWERLEAEGVAADTGMLFISVDPARDTPERLASYVTHFHPEFTGATGDRAALDRLTKALGIAYTVHDEGGGDSYSVDHSSAVLLINPAGRLQAVFQPPHGRRVLAGDYLRMRERYGEEG
ncbi:SCO family protein [Spiribacter halobius]|uniref:SCO family protein n=1 Tax=Sediminicurvatus halobius TaxID=2182432 RepID=A0A2U2MWR6_9GAMM|nr:SCO family protein [Spiribacter halobius]PWG61301.1 SCO family protein [Spiribacter halobius]UEX78975.1 SCO family protein [Spiribacter halobius]